MTFVNELIEITNKAKARILEVLKVRGTNYELTDPSELEDDVEDSGTMQEILYDLPRGIKYGKYGSFDEYCLYAINIDDKENISLMGMPIEGGGDVSFLIDELGSGAICHIADLVNKLEN